MDPEFSSDLRLNDVLEIKADRCLGSEASMKLCMKPLNDSRCPTGARCIWAGDAIVQFQMKMDDKSIPFELHTHHNFRRDTLINGFRIKLIDVFPYPDLNKGIVFEDYYAKILIYKE